MVLITSILIALKMYLIPSRNYVTLVRFVILKRLPYVDVILHRKLVFKLNLVPYRNYITHRSWRA